MSGPGGGPETSLLSLISEGKTMNANDPRVVRMARAIVDFVDALESAKSTSPRATTHYTSNRKRTQPSGKTSRWCRDNFRFIPGARKEGRDWVVSVADYDRWTEQRSGRAQTPMPGLSMSEREETWSPSKALKRAKVRLSEDEQ